jgi:hypothetical protein
MGMKLTSEHAEQLILAIWKTEDFEGNKTNLGFEFTRDWLRQIGEKGRISFEIEIKDDEATV